MAEVGGVSPDNLWDGAGGLGEPSGALLVAGFEVDACAAEEEGGAWGAIALFLDGGLDGGDGVDSGGLGWGVAGFVPVALLAAGVVVSPWAVGLAGFWFAGF